MTGGELLQLVTNYNDSSIRRIWDESKQKWFFSIIDIITVLTNSIDPNAYWRKLKERLIKEGNETVTNCHRLKLKALDGKLRFADVADMETIFRLIQSIPSPKAEPLKMWLAKVGHERVQELADPELSINRGRKNWQRLRRSEKWIQQRMMGQETRNKLTDYWVTHKITKEQEFAILTNLIHLEWSGVTVKQHKQIKGLKQQNLRDHMSEAELIFTALAELSTRQIAETIKASGLVENADAGKQGGKISKHARVELETKTGKKVVTPTNYLVEKKVSKRFR